MESLNNNSWIILLGGLFAVIFIGKYFFRIIIIGLVVAFFALQPGNIEAAKLKFNGAYVELEKQYQVLKQFAQSIPDKLKK